MSDDSSLNTEQVLKIARLCRLELTQEEAVKLTPELNNILGHISALNEVNTEGVEPMSHVHGSENIFREDAVVAVELDKDVVKKNYPRTSGAYIEVPIIVEE